MHVDHRQRGHEPDSGSRTPSFVRPILFLALFSLTVFLFVGTSAAQDAGGVEIDEALYDQDGDRTEVVVRFGGSGDMNISELKAEAEQNAAAVEEFARGREDFQMKRSIWLANAVVVEVDRQGIENLSGLEEVDRLHSNFEIEHHGVTASATSEPLGGEEVVDTPFSVSTQSTYTYGLEQINAPGAWNEFGTRGDGSRVAVLDTGVEPEHADIDLYTDNPDDPRYPGGWAEFDENGNRLPNSEPYDSHGHGTHVSGIVAGGDGSGTHIGVAPDAELMHALVIEGETGTFAQVVGGMEWAVENDADVMSMSFGFQDYADAFIDPIRNSRSQGVMTVASSGNSGDGTSSSPGNVYDSVSVGATDSNENVPSFSSGEPVDTQDSWDSPPSDWPDEYTVPNVVSPGVSVKSAVPDGGYGTKSGTSMSAPHVSGTLALMLSAAGGSSAVTPGEAESALTTSATKPDDWDSPDGEPDSRYGYGIPDAADASRLAASDGEPAFFEVGIDGTNSPVSAGTPVAADVTLKNTGDTSSTQTVTAEIDGVGSDSEDVTLDGISSAVESFSIPTTTADEGEHVLTVSSEDDTHSVTVTVTEGDGEEEEDSAFFGVKIDSTNSPVEEGEPVEVDSTVTNTAESAGTQTVTAELPFGTDSRTVSLDGGSSTTRTFSIPTEASDPGEYSLSVSSEDDTDSATVTVEKQGPTVAVDCSDVSYAGNGTDTSPYEVSTPFQLQCTVERGLNASYVIVSGINASRTADWNGGDGFEPIGDSTAFTGSLDGAGYELSNLSIDRPSEDRVGLFANVGSSGSVEDVVLVNATVSGGHTTGSLVANNRGKVTRSSASGDVVARSGVGGLVGVNEGTVSDTYADVAVDASREAGGLVGRNQGNASTSYSVGRVSGVLKQTVGGFVGVNEAGLSYVYWDVESSGQTSSDGGTGLTTDEMTGEDAVSNLDGFDFTDTWKTGEGSDRYPKLIRRSKISPDNPFGDRQNRPLPIGDAADVLFDWNQDGEVDGVTYDVSEMADHLFEWNRARR